MREATSLIPFDEASPFDLPEAALSADVGDYFAAQIDSIETPGKNLIVYLRKEADEFVVVGIDRNWPGKLVVQPDTRVGAEITFSRFASLDDSRKELLDAPAQAFNEATGRNLTTQQWFDAELTLSERTTFDAVTNALEQTELTDENGGDLGTALDLIVGVERIAGQYSGRGGDQQFRIYVGIKPETEDILQRSTQFHVGHENTVYHVGYPRSYRQEGDVPNMQFSVSDDGLRADIDVDYRSSKSPQALFNGHLTSANSDVRGGDNYDRHSGRWVGLTNWWQDALGGIGFRRAVSANELLALASGSEFPTPLPPDRPLGAAPGNLHEAAQEFFTDWLVREKIDEAMLFFSDRAIACINIDEGNQSELLSVQDAIVAMREIMTTALDQVPARDNLTEAIDAIPPQNDDQAARIEEHPFEGEFTIIQVRNSVAASFMCSTRRGMDPPSMPGGPDALGPYWATVMRFKTRGDQGGAIAFLWDQSEGRWKMLSYGLVEQ